MDFSRYRLLGGMVQAPAGWHTEECPTVAAQFRVQAIPYFVLLRGGIIIAERTGVVRRAEMRRWFATAA
jgi:thioredoxin-like negative regulator of GroEL